MFQMFYLNRPDVLPTGDQGVRKGMVRRCRLTVSNPELKALLVSALETKM
jgi:3-methyladenine DNA glycosylase/8-oxoguanine DNA glycosylase